ncbi:hypothetical protein HELRODRAFT_192146, partial [Helobdella robusta]|uniref:Apextrin C-terminal domain-containing protein n=1 Tax=Helobdella robusta TaxID=6412 RepID=T1FTM6_HELRO
MANDFLKRNSFDISVDKVSEQNEIKKNSSDLELLRAKFDLIETDRRALVHWYINLAFVNKKLVIVNDVLYGAVLINKSEVMDSALSNRHLMEADEVITLFSFLEVANTLKMSGNTDLHKKSKYCIFKKGKCPLMFKDGWIYWDDGGSWLWTTTQMSSGTLPDGTFNRNTKIEYCCRVDGQASVPIILPTQQPFYLLQYGDTCQEVQDMLVREEWLYWVDEWVMNYNKAEGFHPRIIRNPKYTTLLYYCYYYSISGTDPTDPRLSSYLQRNNKFKNSNNSNYSFGWQTFLTIFYVTAAVTGMIFLLAILLAGGQR